MFLPGLSFLHGVLMDWMWRFNTFSSQLVKNVRLLHSRCPLGAVKVKPTPDAQQALWHPSWCAKPSSLYPSWHFLALESMSACRLSVPLFKSSNTDADGFFHCRFIRAFPDAEGSLDRLDAMPRGWTKSLFLMSWDWEQAGRLEWRQIPSLNYFPSPACNQATKIMSTSAIIRVIGFLKELSSNLHETYITAMD